MRFLDSALKEHFLHHPQAMIVLGARQVGKTTLVRRIFPDAVYLLVDNEPIRRLLDAYDIESYKVLIPGGTKTVVLDEIHMLKDPGRAVKILYDQMPGLQIVVTGSSSFHIKNRTGESLAGRKIDYELHPLSFAEYLAQKGIVKGMTFDMLHRLADPGGRIPPERVYPFDIATILDNVLAHGLFPFLVDHPNDTMYLRNFADSLIFKDIIELNLVENKRMAANLLKLLAHQIGNLVNYAELADRLGADQRLVKRYIEIFEQSFLIFRLYPYAANRRNEIVKSPKIYFHDTGLRNAVIDDFSPMTSRQDRGALFENFVIAETLKQNSYSGNTHRLHYWRTKSGSEVDLVIDGPQGLAGVEIKCTRSAAPCKAFTNQYPHATLKSVSMKNFW
jgi:predicted AAA+ superfamily ATPase